MTYLEIEQLSEDIYDVLRGVMTWENLPDPARENMKKQVRKLLEKYDISPKKYGE